jgi:D-alanine-D-alanine ligase-like ATP-grasp enzyme
MKILLFRVPSRDIYRDQRDQERNAIIERTLAKPGVEIMNESSANPDPLHEMIETFKPDLAYSGSAYFPATGTLVQKVFEETKINYVGSSPDGVSLCNSKVDLKVRLGQGDIDSPAWAVARRTGPFSYELSSSLPDFPLILKPLICDSGVGIDAESIVLDRDTLEWRLPAYLAEHGDCLVERYLGHFHDRREFIVSLIGNPDNGILLPVEIRLPPNREYPLITKAIRMTHRTIIATLPRENLRERITDFASKAFIAAGMRDFAQIDILLADGGLNAIGIDCLPMIPDRWFNACAAEAGLEECYLPVIFHAALARIAGQGGRLPALPVALAETVPEFVRLRFPIRRLEHSIERKDLT